MRGELDFIFQCHGNTRELDHSESSDSSQSSENQSVVDGGEVREVNIPESPYRSLAMPGGGESAYACKSLHSHKSSDSKSTKLDSEEEEH